MSFKELHKVGPAIWSKSKQSWPKFRFWLSAWLNLLRDEIYEVLKDQRLNLGKASRIKEQKK